MKLKISIVCVLLASAMLAMAYPPGKGLQSRFATINTAEEVEAASNGEELLIVCTSCKTVKAVDDSSVKDLAAKYRDGGSLHCDTCRKDYKVDRHGPPGKSREHRHAIIVNDKGEECMFVVKRTSAE